MYRLQSKIEFLLVHPGGPYFKNKQLGYWTIPKGLPENDEDLLSSAIREFREETGITPVPPYHPLGDIKQKGGKVVYAWAFEGEWDPSIGIASNMFHLEWPPSSGKLVAFPEIDRALWMDYGTAKQHIIPAQIPFLDQLVKILSTP